MIHRFLPRYRHPKHPRMGLNDAQIEALEIVRNKIELGAYRMESAPCICGDTGGWEVSLHDRYTLPVRTLLCPRCAIMRTSPRLDPDSLDRFYREDYRQLYVGSPTAPDDFFREQVAHGARILEFVRKAAPEKSIHRVFDIGCGAGGTLLPFRDTGAAVCGCDLGEQYLTKGRSEGLKLFHGGSETLRSEPPADLVILSHVLEHMPDPVSELKGISDLIAPEGLLYIELPGIFAIHDTYGDYLLFLQNAHLYHFTLATLKDCLSKAGFNLVHGDQYIWAVFSKTAPCSRTQPRRKEALRIAAYLHILEAYRVLGEQQSISRTFKQSFKNALTTKLDHFKKSDKNSGAVHG